MRVVALADAGWMPLPALTLALVEAFGDRRATSALVDLDVYGRAEVRMRGANAAARAARVLAGWSLPATVREP